MNGGRASRALSVGADADQHPLTPVVATGVTAATLLVAFGLLALGVESFWVVFVAGFGGVLPLSLGALEYQHATGTNARGSSTREGSDDALAELRRRYARGDLTDAEFEERVETLLETEAVTRRRSD